MNCIFNGTAAGTNTEDVLDIIQYGNVSVHLYRDESASGYDYAYRAEFEYGGVFYALHTNSNDPFRIYSVLQTVIGASQTEEPNGESNTFSNILGLNGYYVKIEETPPGFMNWRYFAELDGKTQCVAEVFGYTASGPEVYGKDIDGDGVKELISNCTFGTGTSRVYAYRNNNGVIEQGRLVYDTGDASLFPNLNDWGTNAIQETYDPENGTFIVSYDTETGTGQTVFQDMSRISFQQFRPDT
ncbi:hypothetical protein SDC9_138649 [bioreactor metagenome]|uniref:Uncharacterized protein n=1 Tax=bioreactor metagenome TaxID=1076179 RepID=A0A645DQV9_9ZZZZ